LIRVEGSSITATGASGGGVDTPPSMVRGYLRIQILGTERRIPFYDV